MGRRVLANVEGTYYGMRGAGATDLQVDAACEPETTWRTEMSNCERPVAQVELYRYITLQSAGAFAQEMPASTEPGCRRVPIAKKKNGRSVTEYDPAGAQEVGDEYSPSSVSMM